MTNLNIKLHHGLVNSTPKQRAAAQTLGLNKIGKTVTREDTPAFVASCWFSVTWSPLRRLTDYGRYSADA